MKLRFVLMALAVALTGLVGSGSVSTADASVHHASAVRHACTRKPNGRCIKKGQRCAVSKRGTIGWSATGSKLRCKGKHPHWRKASTGGGGGGAGTHSCTRTSSGSCIQGGEFCKQSEYGETGYDANGDAWTCTGNHTHPHWE